MSKPRFPVVGMCGSGTTRLRLTLHRHADADSTIPVERRHQHTRFNEAPDPSRTFAWKRDMDPCNVALFNRHARRMLGELGYDLPAVRVGEARLAWRLHRRYATRYFRHRSLAGASPRS